MANLLSNTTIGGYQSIHTGNIGSYALTSITSGQITTALGFTPYNATNPSAYITSSNNYYYVNPGNGYGLGFWGQVPTTYGITMANESAGYGVIYGLSEYHLYFSMTGGGTRGFVFRNDAHGAVTQIGAYGWQMWRGELYPGYNNATSGSQTSYYIYGNTNSGGIRTNGNWIVNSDIYLGTRDAWLSTWLNQDVRTSASPSFSTVNLNTLNASDTNARYYYQNTNGVPSNNLGNPTVTEMALFDEQFNNKTAFYNPDSLSFWTSSDGTNYTEYTGFDTTTKKRFLGGDNDSGVFIPNLTNRFRVEVENTQGYVFLNQLYIYWSSNSHSTKVHIWVRRCDNNQWYQWTDSNTQVSSWPGHLYLPFSGIPFYPGYLDSTGHYNRIRIEFIPSWSTGTYSGTSISLMRMQIWGGYPAGKRNIYSTDENRNVTFPSVVYADNSFRAPIFYDLNDTSYYLDPNGTSRLGTLNINQLSVYGNTYLGDGNGDEVHINDILRVGATDSGDAHFYFGEGGSAGSDYGSHWYWDSGYRFTWYTRNAGTDSTLFYYDTNSLSYITWGRSISMNTNSIDYTGQLHFSGGTRFQSMDTHYLKFRTDATDYGSIQVRDANEGVRGYLGYFDSSGFGLLNSSGSWGIRLNPGNGDTLLYSGGNWKLTTISAGISVSGNVYTNQNYGDGLVGVYSAERYQGVFAMGDAYKLATNGTSPGSLYGIAWTHTNVGGQSKSGLGHQALFMMNGQTYTAIGSGIWTDGTITTTSHGTSANWIAAYNWGNHASADYIVRGTQIASSASWTTATRFGSVGDISQGAGNHALSVRSEDGNDAFMSFHIGGDYAVHFGLDRVSNRMSVGGWSDGAVKYQLWDSRDFTSSNISNWSTAYSWGNHASAGYLTSLPSHNHDDRYYTESESDSRYLILGGSWGADLTSNGWTRKVGYAADGGEWVLLSASGQISSLLDGSYFAGEQGGFYSMGNSNTYASRRGFYNDGTYANFNTPLKAASYVLNTGAFMEGYGSYSSKLGRVAMISFDWNSTYDEPYNHGIMSTSSDGSFSDNISINSFNDITLRLDANNNNTESYLRVMNNTPGTNTIAHIGYNGANGVASFSRDLYVNGGTGGNFGNRIVVGADSTPYTMQDANIRPTVYVTGAYPVVALNHTVTGNTSHGPTVQFTFDGLSQRQWVIGCGGAGEFMDFGFSNNAYGNSNYNPHNGIGGYQGNTIMRIIDNAVGIGGDWGAHGSGAGNPAYTLDVRGTIYSNTDMRAPIFYDSQDTGYYLDPNSTSVLNGVGTHKIWNHNLGSTYYFAGGDWGLRHNTPSGWIQFGPANSGHAHIYTDRPNFYFNADLLVNGNSVITSANIGSQSVSYASTAGSAPANGGNSSTVGGYSVSVGASANTIPTRNASGYFIPESWIQLNGSYGLYSPTYNAHIRPNTGTYGAWEMIGSKGSWAAIYFVDSGNYLMANNNEVGHYQNGVGWKYRWYQGTMYVSRSTTGGGTEFTVLDSGNYSTWAQPIASAINTGNIGSQSVSNSNYINSTRDTPSGALQYWNAPSLGLDEAPSSDWHNTIRMGHGSPLSYYSNTLAVRMTGSGVGDIYTQTIMNGNRQGWKKHWNDGNHGSGSGLDADLLDGQQGSYYQPASSAITTSNIGSQSVSYASTAGTATNLYGTGGSSIQSSSTGTSYSVNYQIRENAGGSGNTNEIYAPQLAFHWGGVVASSIMMESSGRMAIRNNPGGSYENFIAAVIYSSGYGDSTQWNTAYSWGNHASAGYQAASTAINTSNIGSQTVSYASKLNPLSGDSNYKLAYTADGARTNAGEWGRAVMYYVPNGQTYGIRVDRADYADSAGSAPQLTKYGDIYGQNWNDYYVGGKLIVSAALGMSGANKPPTSYDYGVALSYGESGGPLMQMYFPENSGNIGTIFRKGTYRTGWNGNWSTWKTFVEQEGNLCTIVGGNGTGLEVHGNVGYNQDPLTYFLLRGQADTSWKALKVRLTGDAGGQDIEFRRIAENGADSRMWYVPRGANTVNFDYPIVQPSDSRLKDNITPISTPVDKIKSLRGVEFDWNSGEQVGTHDVGLIAQDVEAVLPEAVTTQEDGYKNLAYTKVIPLLVEAMKEQQAMIEALKAEVELLKNK